MSELSRKAAGVWYFPRGTASERQCGWGPHTMGTPGFSTLSEVARWPWVSLLTSVSFVCGMGILAQPHRVCAGRDGVGKCWAHRRARRRWPLSLTLQSMVAIAKQVS